MECFHLLPAMVYRASFFFPFQEDFTTLGTDGTLQEDFTTPDRDGTLQEDFTTPDRDGTLQDSTAPAIQKESLRDESKRMVMGLDPDKFPLLNPSRMGTSVLDDLAVTVIKKLAG